MATRNGRCPASVLTSRNVHYMTNSMWTLYAYIRYIPKPLSTMSLYDEALHFPFTKTTVRCPNLFQHDKVKAKVYVEEV